MMVLGQVGGSGVGYWSSVWVLGLGLEVQGWGELGWVGASEPDSGIQHWVEVFGSR